MVLHHRLSSKACHLDMHSVVRVIQTLPLLHLTQVSEEEERHPVSLYLDVSLLDGISGCVSSDWSEDYICALTLDDVCYD